MGLEFFERFEIVQQRYSPLGQIFPPRVRGNLYDALAKMNQMAKPSCIE